MRIVFSCLALAALIALPVQAEMVLDEVVVTARKKEESLQHAPLSLSVVSKETIESSFLGDATGIAQYSPNLVFDAQNAGTVAGASISIRGVSYQDVEKSDDPTVLIHLDGVPLGTNTGNAMNLLDIERIEVLRGPQGTLFGKNTIGGVINIWRRKPMLGRWAGKVRAGQLDKDHATTLEGVLNIPLGDAAAAKVNLAMVEQPAWFANITTGKDQGDSKEKRFGIHFLWQPSASLRAELQYNRSDMDGTLLPILGISDSRSVFCFEFNICAANEHEPYSGNRRKGAGGLINDFSLDGKDYQLDLNWSVNAELDAVLIAAHRELQEVTYIDFDDSPLELYHTYRPNDYEQDSLEARVNYEEPNRLSLTAGFFYWDAGMDHWRNELEASLFFGVSDESCGFDTLPCAYAEASSSSQSVSWFFEGDFRFLARWTLTAGARSIRETKKLRETDAVPILGIEQRPWLSAKRTFDDIIYHLGLRWEPTDELMAYASLSTGFRSGGFNIRAESDQSFLDGYRPEKVDNIELGLKSTWLDRRLRLNAALYRMSYDDIQLAVNIPAPNPPYSQAAIQNVGTATVQGLELEMNALLSSDFSLDFNAAYLDAGYDKFIGRVQVWEEPGTDNSQLKMRRAPKWTYTAALNYRRALGKGELSGRVSYNWREHYEGTESNFPGTRIESYGILDASLSYKWSQWQLNVFGRNLSNEDEYTHTYVVGPGALGFQDSSFWIFATPRPPRAFGVEVVYTFGGY